MVTERTPSFTPEPRAVGTTNPGSQAEATTTGDSLGVESHPAQSEIVAINKLSISGIRHALADRRAAKIEARLDPHTSDNEQEEPPVKMSRKEKKHELRALWGEAAEKGQPFGEVAEDGVRFKKGDKLWPRDQKEEAIAQRAYRAKDHRKVIRAAMRVAEGGTYEIDVETGKSKHRQTNAKLKQFPRATRNSIKKEEKKYRKLRKKIEHANHILHPHHKEKPHTDDTTKLQEKAQDKRKRADKLKTKAQVATARKDIKRVKRRAFAGEVVKAWRGRTDAALEHRERFYEDLGRVADPSVQGAAERMRVGTYDVGTKDNEDVGPFSGSTEGGLIERAVRRNVRRHKDALNYHGEKNLGQGALKRKKILEQRAEKYREHKPTTGRRRANAQKLAEIRKKNVLRYQELHEAKQRLANLRRPTQP